MLPAPGFIRRKAWGVPHNAWALGPLHTGSLTPYSLVEPAGARQYSSFAQPRVRTHREQCLTGSISRGVNGLRGTMRQEGALHREPQMSYRMQLRSLPAAG